MTGEGCEGGISQLRVRSPRGGNAKTLGPHSGRHTTHLPFSLCFSSFSFSLQVSPLLGFFLLPLLPQSTPGGPLGFKREKEGSSHLLIIHYLLEGHRHNISEVLGDSSGVLLKF